MGAFFAALWALIKNAPLYISTYLKVRDAIKAWSFARNKAAQDKIVQELKDEAAKAIAERDQRGLETKISGEEGGLPATIRDGVTEHDSDDRLARQAREREIQGNK